jgi:hypothetical protein
MSLRPDTLVDHALQAVECRLQVRGGGGDHIGVAPVGQWCESEEGGVVEHPSVSGVVVQAVGADVGQQHPKLVVGAADERHVKPAAHHAATTVGTDQV